MPSPVEPEIKLIEKPVEAEKEIVASPAAPSVPADKPADDPIEDFSQKVDAEISPEYEGAGRFFLKQRFGI